VQDAIGNTHSYLYSSGLLQNIQDGSGRLVTFQYSGGLIQSIEYWASRRTTYLFDTVSAAPINLLRQRPSIIESVLALTGRLYDSPGCRPGCGATPHIEALKERAKDTNAAVIVASCLTTVIGPTGCQTGYQYSELTVASSPDWYLTGIVDPNGYGTSYTYSSVNGQVTAKIIEGIGATSYTYITGGVQIQNVLGSITTQLTNSDFANTGGTDPLGNRFTITRNANLQQVSYENRLGAIWTTIWGYAGSSFDTTGVKRRKQVTIDPLGNAVTMQYTARGQLPSTQDMSGAIVTLGYNSFGDQISRQDGLGFLWTTTRDLASNPIAEINPLNAIWSQTFDNMNRPLVATDPLNNISQNGYDSWEIERLR
jgi:hypothetical protein